jgi:hypothetical protein
LIVADFSGAASNCCGEFGLLNLALSIVLPVFFDGLLDSPLAKDGKFLEDPKKCDFLRDKSPAGDDGLFPRLEEGCRNNAPSFEPFLERAM